LVEQFRVSGKQALLEKLDAVVQRGGEGLMLHRADSLYKSGRSDDLLKLKRYRDAEAIVIAHQPGNGKYAGLLGSMLVETGDGKRFRIGSGFSNEQRHDPPPIGSVITYKYFGLTANGIPRFASFLRVRQER
jgi:DNA ligase-1